MSIFPTRPLLIDSERFCRGPARLSDVKREHLRPIERRLLDMRDQGMAVDEIADRMKRSPAHVERMLEWTAIPRTGSSRERDLRRFHNCSKLRLA